LRTTRLSSNTTELIIVGNGQPRHAIDFRDTDQVKSPLYVDPELHAYAAASRARSGQLEHTQRFSKQTHRWSSGQRIHLETLPVTAVLSPSVALRRVATKTKVFGSDGGQGHWRRSGDCQFLS
jgi:hypothetical protein